MEGIKTYRDLMKALADGHTIEVMSVIDDRWITIKEFPFKVYKLDDELRFEHRIKPSKPSINWEHVSKEFNYLATNKNGRSLLFKNKPSSVGWERWVNVSADPVNAEGFSSFKAGNCDWTESLVERPDSEEK